MKKLISLIVLISMIPSLALADCDWSKGITPGPNHTFIYSEACHLQVGQLVQDAKVKDQQISDLNKAIQLKDLALVQSDQRTQLWIDTSNKEQDRMNKVDEEQRHSDFIYFGLGILATLGTGFAVARLTK
jgi:hypothetical protein